jgi:glycosyltransferase involved in cell wall biosynthesis
MKKKILVITQRPVYPIVSGDRLRIYYICRELSKEYRIHLICLTDIKDYEKKVESDDIFDQIEYFYKSKLSSFFNVIIYLLSSVPMQVAYFFDKKLEKKIDNLLRNNDYVAVMPHLIRVAKNVKRTKVPVLLEMTDSIAMNYSKFRNFKMAFSGLKNIIFALDAGKTKKYEAKCIKNYDHTFLISDIDKSFILNSCQELKSKITVSANGCDFNNKIIPAWKDNTQNTIIFMGFIKSRQNFDAALFFIKNVMPIFTKKNYNFKLMVVGEISQKDKKYLEKFDNVIVTGRVKSFTNYFSKGFVGICPVRVGAGQQNKILEYIKYCLPVVTSPLGLEGYDLKESKHIFIAETPDDYANQIIRIYNNKELSYDIAMNAYEYVSNNMSWQTTLTPMMGVIKSKAN